MESFITSSSRMTREDAQVYCSLLIGGTSGATTWGVASCAGASSKTALIAGASTAGGVWLACIVAAIYCCVYDKEDNLIDDNITSEATSLLSHESIDDVKSDNPDEAYSAAMLAAGYGAMPLQTLSPYEAGETRLDTVDVSLQRQA